MTEYINRDTFLEQQRTWYCKDCNKRKNSKGKTVYEIGEAPCRACDVGTMLDAVEDYPAADVVERTQKNSVNLCDSCRYDYPECPSGADDVLYGNGIGNDNICCCNKYCADVVKRKTCKNLAVEYDDCDQFVCSQCGIELQDWRRVEHDEDDGDVTYNEYRFRFCPNCGAKIKEGDDDV